jgi:hypothetical protein
MREVDVPRKCIVLRNGYEIWLEVERADRMEKLLSNVDCPRFVKIGDILVNTADISGIFPPEGMKEKQMRDRGYWKCQHGIWHDKRDKEDNCKTNAHCGG